VIGILARQLQDAYSRRMPRIYSGLIYSGLMALLALTFLSNAAAATPKVHIIAFGKWTTVDWLPGTGDNKSVTLKVRALVIDGRTKEHFLGPLHEVTERLFVVRRVFRVNDSLSEESGAPRWQWQRGGWMLVDRSTGHISPVVLPLFDNYYSVVSWYQDYAAYCGVSDDGKKVYAIVAQLSRHKAVLKKPIAALPDNATDETVPDSACLAPAWQRRPARVSFEPSRQVKQTFVIRGHVVDAVSETDEEEEASK
jgi:hypothetical protein